MSQRGGLGRGLGALIPGAGSVQGATSATKVHVEDIRPNPDQPRMTFSEAELQSLAASIREHGVLQPLVVVKDPSGAGYRLVAGERRLRAARLAGLDEVPVVLRDAPEGESSLALSLIENIQRDDLNPLEEAEAYRRLLEEFGLSQEMVARQVGKTRAHVSNTVRLLALAPALRGALMSGAITAGHGRAVAALDHNLQEDALRRILRDEMNVRETEALTRELEGASPTAPRVAAQRAARPEIAALEGEFREALRTKVRITGGGKRGRVVIDFYSADELDAIYRHIVRGERPRA